MDIKLSTQEIYGVRGMLALSRHADRSGGGATIPPLQVKAIAEERGLSVGFLEQSMNLLRKGGLVEGVRGMRGGYRLTRPAEQIGLGEILRAIEGSAQKKPSKPTPEERVLSEVEVEIDALLSGRLATISLRALAQRVQRMEAQAAPMFHI